MIAMIAVRIDGAIATNAAWTVAFSYHLLFVLKNYHQIAVYFLKFSACSKISLKTSSFGTGG